MLEDVIEGRLSSALARVIAPTRLVPLTVPQPAFKKDLSAAPHATMTRRVCHSACVISAGIPGFSPAWAPSFEVGEILALGVCRQGRAAPCRKHLEH
jgi:hypothetical protein